MRHGLAFKGRGERAEHADAQKLLAAGEFFAAQPALRRLNVVAAAGLHLGILAAGKQRREADAAAADGHGVDGTGIEQRQFLQVLHHRESCG